MAANVVLPSSCPFCGGRFKDPKVMPCFHIFCRECIRGLKVAGMEELKCPVDHCSNTFKLENDDPETLPDAFPVYFKQDLNRLRDKVENKTGHCLQCLQDKKVENVATAFCDQCQYICKGCVKAHRKKGSKFSQHEVKSFLELSNSEGDSECYEVLKQQRLMSFTQTRGTKCKVHQGQRCESYCLDCLMFTCAKCMEVEHCTHRIKNREWAFEECKVELQERLPNIRLLYKRASSIAEEIQKMKVRVEDQCKELESSINHTFDRLHKILEQRKTELHRQLNGIADMKINSLHKQLSELQQLAGKLQRLESFTDTSIEQSTGTELLTNYNFLKTQMDLSIKEGSGASTQLVETANMALKNSALQHLRDVSQKHIRLYAKQANPGSCTAEGVGLAAAETYEIARFHVNLHDRLHKLCTSEQDVSVLVKCLENDFQAFAEVVDVRYGRSEVRYCPQFRGNHEITVHVNGKHIIGSPFHLCVTMPPEQLGQSQGTIADVMGPRGITIDESGHLLVCEWNGNKVVKLDKLGRQVMVYGIGHVSHPASITLDRKGCFYVTDGSGYKSQVVKFESNGRMIRSVGEEGHENKQFKNPRGVKVSIQNEVYVCDRDNHRIQVFDLRLNFKRCIELRVLDSQLSHPAKPNDIAFDSGGTIYVADYANDCILVLSPSEQYLYFFGKKSGMNQPPSPVHQKNHLPLNTTANNLTAHVSVVNENLAGPECIAIDENDIIYVTESGNHRVSVYRTSGELVSRFGSIGRDSGELKLPMGITIDRIGSVYVCELLNNRIQIF